MAPNRSRSVQMSTPARPSIAPLDIASLLNRLASAADCSRELARRKAALYHRDRAVMSHSDRSPLTSDVIEMRVPVAPGVTAYVERRNGDPAAIPFVLVHGLASNLRLWDGVAEHLHARGHTVVAVDQRGHGRSDAPDSTYGMDTAVTDLQTIIDALALVRPVLAGQSWGGNVVLE